MVLYELAADALAENNGRRGIPNGTGNGIAPMMIILLHGFGECHPIRRARIFTLGVSDVGLPSIFLLQNPSNLAQEMASDSHLCCTSSIRSLEVIKSDWRRRISSYLPCNWADPLGMHCGVISPLFRLAMPFRPSVLFRLSIPTDATDGYTDCRRGWRVTSHAIY